MKSVPVLFKLVLAHNRKRWMRMTLGILGIAVSICLVVWVIRRVFCFEGVMGGK